MKKIMIKDYKVLEERLKNVDKYISEKDIMIALGISENCYQVR